MSKKKRKMHGTVKKVIKPIDPRDKERAEIDITEADDLYREIRVENVLTDENGGSASLKPGAEVDLIVEANTDAKGKTATCSLAISEVHRSLGGRGRIRGRH